MTEEKETKYKEAYRQSLALLHTCVSPHGFLASPTERDNYKRVFARDSAIMGTAALATNDEVLVEATKQSILTLAEFQGEHGEIPSNVDKESGHVSYGGTAGRVDATLWFVILVALYHKKTKEEAFLENMLSHVEKAIWLLGAWEFNQKGFIYVPPTGDWADEYVQQGYILSDQALYYKALRSYSYLLKELGKDAEKWDKKAENLSNLIQSNFGICEGEDDSFAYHSLLRDSGTAYCREDRKYWMPYFTPYGYGHHFDAFANILVSLLDIADDTQRDSVDEHIHTHVHKSEISVLPAFDPVITEGSKDWNDLKMAFSYSFKNKPYEYHNGGLWPMLTGFYVLDLARRGKKDVAEKYLEGINTANQKGQEGEEWGFYEFLHGQSAEPRGTKNQGWSAGAGVLGYHACFDPESIIF